MSILSPAGGLENETLTVVCEKKIKVRYLALVSVSMTAAMKFQISQSFELFFRFLKIFFWKGDGRLSVRIGFALGVKIGPLSRTIFSHVSWISIYFLKGVPEFGHVFGFIFWSHRRTWFWIWVCPKKTRFFEKMCIFFRKNGWLGAPWGPKIRFTSGANLSHVLHVSFESCRRVLYRVPGRGRFWSRLQGPEPEQVTVTNSTWQKNR